ncbi:M56 family metallopeptidase [Colwellia psychrerythraea]|uniref:Peptidase M48 Ste24p n=1 Tax=Colwellia psychrerythraea TaxID=28229 RepID=A0A099KM44_COLPS|nr:M56 family metallopeptidase [Colwellia psychrerythraea]KGJ90997.1 peptidase M48 Ste24p [Colwellia psychrerythraea]
MVTGQLAVWLNIITIVILAFVIANLTVSAIVSLLTQKFISLQVKSRKIVLWLLVILPWLTSIFVALVFLNGYTSATIFEAELDYAHWHHMSVFSSLSWHGATLIIALIFTLYILVKKLIQLKRHHQDLAQLTSFSKPLTRGVFEIELAESSAFTAGFIDKKCFITSGMLKEMTDEEIAVILGHERAHAKMNDPLKKWLFSIFTAFFIPSLAAHLKLHMTLAMEQAADNAVVNNDITSTFVASTLVKAARLNALYSPVKNNELVANFGADVLEQRVYFLLGQLNLKPVNKMLTVVLVIFILAVCFSSIDGVHHLIETVLSH